jgi:hypothetical protein
MSVGSDVFDGAELGYFHSYQPARVAVNPLGVRLIKFSVVKNPDTSSGMPIENRILISRFRGHWP